jgi:uncharacterized protein
MKIHVNRVPAEGLREQVTYDPVPMDMDRDDIRVTQPFSVQAVATKADQELVVWVHIHCPLRCSCARCLEEFEATVRSRATFSYTVQPTDVVDITDDVRQEIILGYPAIPLCGPDCRGLCRVCGQNLNRASCRHQAAG